MPNRLAQASSLYLRKHGDNPIDWWPWCDEALAKAKTENKPIFLSIGYSSCHWCTVMEGEAFSNLEIAEYLNQNFLPIKVDREERPDLDSIYMQTLQMMRQQGGWPLNIFLAPEDLIPFYGGTYFPVEPRYGMAGFLQVLQTLRHYYDQDKAQLENIKQEIFSNLQQMATFGGAKALGEDLLRQGLETSSRIISPNFSGNSFPMIPYSQAALRLTRFNGEAGERADQTTQQRGFDLALGGIFDQVGGGFHRYTVDASWTVPHFEKMLYDNGQILEYLANLWRKGVQDPAFRRAVAKTVTWLTREMTAPQGYFYAAQDADSFIDTEAPEPEEGAFYVWSYGGLRTYLDELQLLGLTEAFHITSGGNFEGNIVLQRRRKGDLNAIAEEALAQLFIERYGTPESDLETFAPARSNQAAKTHPWPRRIPAVTDTKMIVAWNSLMISGLAHAAVALGQPDYYTIACRAAQFIQTHQWQDGKLHRLNYDGPDNGQVAVLAQSEDYALWIKALLDLHQAQVALGLAVGKAIGEVTQGEVAQGEVAQGEASLDWLELAIQAQEEFDQSLWNLELGGYNNTAQEASESLLVRERSYGDNATPAANGVAAANLVQLALLTEDLDYLDRAEQTLQAFGDVMVRSPQSCPSLFGALDWFRNHTLVKTSPDLVQQLSQGYYPTTVFKTEANLPDGSVGLVCQGLTCQEPAESTQQLLEQLTQIGSRIL